MLLIGIMDEGLTLIYWLHKEENKRQDVRKMIKQFSRLYSQDVHKGYKHNLHKHWSNDLMEEYASLIIY